MLAFQEDDKKCLLIKTMAACRMPQPVAVCLITLAREHPPALCTCTMAIHQGRRLMFMGLCPQRGIICHLVPRGVVALVRRVKDWAWQHVSHSLHTGNKHGR